MSLLRRAIICSLFIALFSGFQTNPNTEKLKWLIETKPREICYYISKDNMNDREGWTRATINAFETWQDVTKDYLVFKYKEENFPAYACFQVLDGEHTKNDKNEIFWVRDRLDGMTSKSYGKTHVQRYNDQMYIKNVDIFFYSDVSIDNEQVLWQCKASYSKEDGNVIDVQSAACHEVGHFIGLRHIEGKENIDCVMYEVLGTGDIRKRILKKKDREALFNLYKDI